MYSIHKNQIVSSENTIILLDDNPLHPLEFLTKSFFYHELLLEIIYVTTLHTNQTVTLQPKAPCYSSPFRTVR